MSTAKTPSKDPSRKDDAAHAEPMRREEAARLAKQHAHAQHEALDSRVEDPYDNVACTD